MCEPTAITSPTHGPTFEKVTVFVLRTSPAGPELLTFLHPAGGRQLPAGSVEPDEPLEEAALREVREETGLDGLFGLTYLGQEEEDLGDEAVALVEAHVRDPSRDSVQVIKRGHRVRVETSAGETYRVVQLLYDLTVEPAREFPGIRGEAADADFARRLRRTFWLAWAKNDGRSSWTQDADGHQFWVEWVPLSPTPDLVAKQAGWLAAHGDAIAIRLREGGKS